MNKTLLVPTDFSANAKCALEYAISLAKKGGYKILLLNGFEVNYPTSEIPIQMVTDEISISQRKAEAKLTALCKQTVLSSKIKCNCFVKEGTATDVILETAKKTDPDFIIMGTKGASGVKEVLFGSNTARVIEKARCPVIAIPQNGTFQTGDILFATDYHLSDIEALKEAAKIAKQFKSRIILFHVADNELTEDTEEGLMDKFLRLVSKKVKFNKFVPRVEYGISPEKTLQEFIKAKKPGLIAMSTKQRTLIEKLFNSSITKKMAYHTNIPLLAFHYKKGSDLYM